MAFNIGDVWQRMPDNSLVADHSQDQVHTLTGNVVCFGFLTYCLLLMVEHLPSKNGGAFVSDTVDTVGDDAAIVAAILNKWGVPASLISSPVGNDYHGEKVVEHLKAWGVDVEQRVSEGLTTPLEVGIVDASGARTYFQRRDPAVVAALTAPTPAQLSGAGMLYVDWYDGPSVLAAMEIATSQAIPIFLNLEAQYDTNPALPDLLRYTGICQISMDEPGASGDPVDVARWLNNQGVGTALITLGAEGCVVAQGRQAFSIRPPKLEVIDGYGAGAAFSAGIIYGLRAGWPLESCARFASAYAGLKCGVMGMAELPISEIQKAAATMDVRPLLL